MRVVGFPLFVLYFLVRGYRDPRYFRTLGERLGALPPSFQRTAPGAVWLHAVSVGEVITGIRLIEELRRANPQVPVFLSTATLAGRAVAEQKAKELVDGIFYAPIDSVFAVRRVLRTIRPSVVVVLETEIWPVLYRETKRTQCGLLVFNGRISDRALPRYRKFRWAFAPVLAYPDAIYVQTERDAQRYASIGAPPASVQAFGNLKYDAAPVRTEPPPAIVDWLARLKPERIWIAASTMPGRDAADIDEDDAVIAAYQDVARRHPGLLMILVPRRPERFPLAAAKLREAGIPFFQRSSNALPDGFTLPAVLLLDTMGELASLFPLADVVFMGGTLPRRGGHNVLEPAVCGRPIVVGPHMENFAEIAETFREHDAWLEIESPAGLAPAVDRLLRDPGDFGQLAASLAAQNTGVAQRAAAKILDAQDRAIPQFRARRYLWPLAKLWEAGGRRAQVASKLDRPVISVGGIAMGGTGKTPFVEMLARELRAQGLQPAILTRGYRRRSPDRSIVIPAGESASTWQTGDEAQIFVRSGLAHVGIGADRWLTGQLLQEHLAVDVFLLDDGFQHRRLHRDLDIVLIDALNPFPGGVFPVGTMREPVEALARAHVFVITRAQPGRRYEGIKRVLREANPKAPVFLATVAPKRWVPELPAGPAAAFCGLGNPATFWQTLHELKVDPVFTWTFGDHHNYRPKELRRIAFQAKERGAVALLTTEKDAMNLPENAADLVAPLEICYLKIETEIDRTAELQLIVREAVLRVTAH